jgi:hypothetical protein
MTVKQAILRYLKNKGLYGPLISFYKITNISNNLSASEIFYMAKYFLRKMGAEDCWYYSKRECTFGDFVENEIIFKRNIKMPKEGDVISVKTLDGKYTFDYIVVDYPKPSFGFVTAVTENEYNFLKNKESKNIYYGVGLYNSIKLDRILKLNKKDVCYNIDFCELRNNRVYNILNNYFK